jgi:hypothetical protein
MVSIPKGLFARLTFSRGIGGTQSQKLSLRDVCVTIVDETNRLLQILLEKGKRD